VPMLFEHHRGGEKLTMPWGGLFMFSVLDTVAKAQGTPNLMRTGHHTVTENAVVDCEDGDTYEFQEGDELTCWRS
jgi:hypothetical protein